jgi:hypothetical protein
MSDWDENSAQLEANLAGILKYASAQARSRSKPTLAHTLKWHKDLMRGLKIPPLKDLDTPLKSLVGRFRGIAPLGTLAVEVGSHRGVSPEFVPAQLKAFEQELQRSVKMLDAQIGADLAEADLAERDLTAGQILEVLRLCAWVHAEWIRIHPFANGNGRTARIWANCMAIRYSLPPFVRLRPRPGHEYEAAGASAMEGYWEKTFLVFLRMYEEYDE